MIEDKDVDHPDVMHKVKEIEDSLAQESAGGALNLCLYRISTADKVLNQVLSNGKS
jgi:hypothetical protein